MRRRRIPRDLTDRSAWEAEREVLIDRDRRSGLGIRPSAWWELDSGRPDLAAGSRNDVYCHLRGRECIEAAAERLSYLIATGELTDSERAAIQRGAAAGVQCYGWRSRLLISPNL